MRGRVCCDRPLITDYVGHISSGCLLALGTLPRHPCNEYLILASLNKDEFILCFCKNNGRTKFFEHKKI